MRAYLNSVLLISFLSNAVAGTTVENACLSIAFTDGGLLADVLNKRSQMPYTTRKGYPFELRQRDPATKELSVLAGIRLEKRSASEDGGRQLVTLDYSAAEGEVKVRCKVTAEETPLTLWEIQIDNRSAREIVEVVFPILHGVRIGPECYDDVLVVPRGMMSGLRMTSPQTSRLPAWASRPGDDVWASTDGIKTGYAFRYPGVASCMWFDLSDPTGGLYLASHDKQTLNTNLEVIKDDRIHHVMRMCLRKFAYIPPGARWESEPYAVGVHPADWHWSADRYREWAMTWMVKPEIPEWFKWADGWGVGHPSLTPQFHRDHSQGYDLRLPFPREGEEAFAARIAAAKAKGQRMSFYFNAQAWRTDFVEKGFGKDVFPKLLPIPEDTVSRMPKPDQIHANASTGYQGRHNGQYFKPDKKTGHPYYDFMMCPVTDFWQRHLEFWCVDKYLGEYGASCLYLDQTAAPPPQICTSLDHGHQHHGSWGLGMVALLKRLLEKGRKLDPEMAITLEGCADIYGQYATAQVISPAATLHVPHVLPEVFHYTFPHYILLDGFSNGDRRYPGDHTINEIFLQGNRFDLLRSASREHASRVVALRREIKRFLYPALFRDTVGLTVTDPLVRAKRFVRDDRDGKGVVVTIYNKYRRQDCAITVGVASYGPIREVYRAIIGSSLEEVGLDEVKVDSDRVRFRVPRDVLSAFVLVSWGEVR